MYGLNMAIPASATTPLKNEDLSIVERNKNSEIFIAVRRMTWGRQLYNH